MRSQDQAAAETETAPPGNSNRWPPQIKYIVGNEACERFSYYGMRSILAGYITGQVVKGGLAQDADTSTVIIHTFVFANYFMPLFGAWLSDKIIGRYHTILWVSLFYCAGHGTLACSDFVGGVHGKLICLCVGLALIAFGSGGIKPCVSAFMGDQFKPEQSHLLQKAYGAFYWSINFGSFFSFLIIPWIKDNEIKGHYNYSLAFGVPGILMAVATFIFWLGTKHYVRVPAGRQTKTAGFLSVFFAAYANHARASFHAVLNILTTIGLPLFAMLLMAILSFIPGVTPTVRTIGWVALVCVGLWYVLVVATSLAGKSELPENFWAAARTRYSESEIIAARSIGPILFVFALIPVFWTLFDQTSSTWVLQGNRMNPCTLFGLKVGAEQMQSANPALVMILVPLFTLGIYPHLGRFASPLRRMAYGMFLAAFSYVIVAVIQSRVDIYWHWVAAQYSVATAHLPLEGPLGPPYLLLVPPLSVLWQTVPYIILTAAEVLLSTTGLEFAFREAAPQMKSTVMSFWLLTVAFGNLLVTTITKVFSGHEKGAHEESVSTGRFLLYAGLTFAVAILFSFVATSYRYRDEAAARGK